MIELNNGYSLNELPIKDLTKYSDLLEYEGPILSHFKDCYGNDYLYYWVDYDNQVNRWLIWRIDTDQLIQYLLGFKSLREVLLAKNKDFVYSTEINADLNYSNIRALNVEDLDEAYIPEEESYYILAAPQVYNDLLLGSNDNAYLPLLRKKALYYHLKPSSPKFLSTVSASDAGKFLTGLTKSFQSFAEIDFYKSFKDVLDLPTLERNLKLFKKNLEPRIVSLNYSSFNVGISTDTIHGSEDKDIRQWQREILDHYKTEVVDVDYDSDKAAKAIHENYSDEERSLIYGPYIDAINNKSLKIVVSDAKKSFKKTYSQFDRQTIVPKKSGIQKMDSAKKFVVMVMEVPKNTNMDEVGKRDIKSGLLQFQEVKEVPITVERLISEDQVLELKEPMTYYLKMAGNQYLAESQEFQIENVTAPTREMAQNAFSEAFIEKYLELINTKTKSELKDKYLEQVKKFIA